MKPILVICPGNPKSGTTSLFYSLCDPNYTNYPLFKEPQCWRRILRGNENMIKHNFETGEPYEMGWTWNSHGFKNYDHFLRHKRIRINHYSNNPMPGMSVKDYSDLIDRGTCNLPTWEDYRLLYLSTSYDRPVMDFSLMNGALNSEELDIVKSELDEHFDIRVIICLRDTITWLTSCKRNFIGTPDIKNGSGICGHYKRLVKHFSSKWPTMIVKKDDFDNKDGVLSTALNEFLGINIPKSWKVGRFNVTSSTRTAVPGYGDDWDVPEKENNHYYQTVKTGVV